MSNKKAPKHMRSIPQLLNKSVYKYEKFHEASQNTTKGEDIPSHRIWPEEWKKIYYKGYGRMKAIMLSLPKNLPKVSLSMLLLERKSQRNFTSERLSKDELSKLIYFTSGIKDLSSPDTSTRMYPSAGKRYPLEIYCIILNSSIPHGIYHYHLKTHSLEYLWQISKSSLRHAFTDDWVLESGCIFIITGAFERSTRKYNNKGYRWVLFEAGHIAQNMYLVSAALKLGCCSIGGFIDNKINKILKIDGIKEAALYVCAIGKTPKGNQ